MTRLWGKETLFRALNSECWFFQSGTLQHVIITLWPEHVSCMMQDVKLSVFGFSGLSLSINLSFLPLPWAVVTPLQTALQLKRRISSLHVRQLLLSNEDQINSISLSWKGKELLSWLLWDKRILNKSVEERFITARMTGRTQKPHQQDSKKRLKRSRFLTSPPVDPIVFLLFHFQWMRVSASVWGEPCFTHKNIIYMKKANETSFQHETNAHPFISSQDSEFFFSLNEHYLSRKLHFISTLRNCWTITLFWTLKELLQKLSFHFWAFVLSDTVDKIVPLRFPRICGACVAAFEL